MGVSSHYLVQFGLAIPSRLGEAHVIVGKVLAGVHADAALGDGALGDEFFEACRHLCRRLTA